eukprot:6184403-Pleurochrysis_carterae.AAC.2
MVVGEKAFLVNLVAGQHSFQPHPQTMRYVTAAKQQACVFVQISDWFQFNEMPSSAKPASSSDPFSRKKASAKDGKEVNQSRTTPISPRALVAHQQAFKRNMRKQKKANVSASVSHVAAHRTHVVSRTNVRKGLETGDKSRLSACNSNVPQNDAW